MPRAFIIRPFEKKRISAMKELDFDLVHKELIGPALKATNFDGGTTAEIKDAGNIHEDMFGLIIEADLVICDITIHNANVFYELGVRHALRKGRTILLKGRPSEHQTPFDISPDRYLSYDVEEPSAAKKALVEAIHHAMARIRETDSPVFRMLPSLPEVDPDDVKTVPGDLIEEVARATAARAAGWLRLLAHEVTGRRFEWPALRLIGKAQWTLKDFSGGRQSWERVQDSRPGDIEANLALSNIYERLYCIEEKPELLVRSSQAAERVLRNSSITRQQRAEALALEGRNLKTLWRRDFDDKPELEERRKAAVGRAPMKAYESYRAAFLEDLNHY
jgi:hypothetical protein